MADHQHPDLDAELRALVETMSPDDLAALVPDHLRSRPTDRDGLAYYLLQAEVGAHPDAHLPCPAGSGCDRCWTQAQVLAGEWASLDYASTQHPHVEREARDLIGFWYQSGAMNGRAIVVHGIPDYEPQRMEETSR